MNAIHQPQQSRFVIPTEKGEAVLDYQLNDQTVDFTRTYVPFRMRGQGHAEQLVETGLQWAKGEGYEIAVSCWYVKERLS